MSRKKDFSDCKIDDDNLFRALSSDGSHHSVQSENSLSQGFLTVNGDDKRNIELEFEHVTHVNFVIFVSIVGNRTRCDVHLSRKGKGLVCCSRT